MLKRPAERARMERLFHLNTIVGVVIAILVIIECVSFATTGILGFSSALPYVFLMMIFYSSVEAFVLLVGTPIVIFYIAKLTSKYFLPQINKSSYMQCLIKSVVICTMGVIAVIVPLWSFFGCYGAPIWSGSCTYF